MNLRESHKSFWTWLLHGWSHRSEVLRLCDSVEALEKLADKVAGDLHLANLEIEFLRSRLANQEKTTVQKERQVQTLWNFIAVRHRVKEPAAAGSIRKILQEAEKR